jgi:hypothetical protein
MLTLDQRRLSTRSRRSRCYEAGIEIDESGRTNFGERRPISANPAVAPGSRVVRARNDKICYRSSGRSGIDVLCLITALSLN